MLLWNVSTGKCTSQVWETAHSDAWSWAHVTVQLFGAIVPLYAYSNIESLDSVQTAMAQTHVREGSRRDGPVARLAAESKSRRSQFCLHLRMAESSAMSEDPSSRPCLWLVNRVAKCQRVNAKVSYTLERHKHCYYDAVDYKVGQDVVHLYALDVLRDIVRLWTQGDWRMHCPRGVALQVLHKRAQRRIASYLGGSNGLCDQRRPHGRRPPGRRQLVRIHNSEYALVQTLSEATTRKTATPVKAGARTVQQVPTK